ncbi:hypothetical protein EDC02_1056 [Micromonospora sp. Llam0]|uniref:hypothetical protein n=1 Tax=Micromonospora sp. Llam0 TaxID=2485143 RepID=UPI000F4A838B|nr:hypothetical protein [Micromonospora sp. Llam0]ROO59261.1 hypothetical protein EDC02_1056 [Micromonospora sp. Llam0]
MGERELGLRRVTMITGGLAVASIAGTLGVAVVAHADHTADQDANTPAGSVQGGTAPQPAGADGQPDPDEAGTDPGEAGTDPAATAGDGQAAPGGATEPDQPVDQAPPTAEFPPVTGGGGEPGQATSGGS